VLDLLENFDPQPLKAASLRCEEARKAINDVLQQLRGHTGSMLTLIAAEEARIKLIEDPTSDSDKLRTSTIGSKELEQLHSDLQTLEEKKSVLLTLADSIDDDNESFQRLLDFAQVLDQIATSNSLSSTPTSKPPPHGSKEEVLPETVRNVIAAAKELVHANSGLAAAQAGAEEFLSIKSGPAHG
jgi:hypothetical protein